MSEITVFHNVSRVPSFIAKGGWYRIARMTGSGTAKFTLSAGAGLKVFEVSWLGEDKVLRVVTSLGTGLDSYSLGLLETTTSEATIEGTQTITVRETTVEILVVDGADVNLSANYLIDTAGGVAGTFELDSSAISAPTGPESPFSSQLPDEALTEEEARALYLPLAGGHMTGGINFGGAVAGDPNDTSKHITFAPTDSTNAGDLSKGVYLYQGNDYLGIGVSSSTMNFVCRNAGDKFDFWTGGVLHTRVDNTGLVVPEGQKLTIAGQDSDERYALKSEIPVIPPPTEAIDAYTKAESDAKYQQLPDNALTQAVADTLYMPIGYVPPVGEVASSATVGDIKAGFQTADHAGWVILDGRAITALTATQQTAATSLGFTTNLPDALNAVPLQNMGVMGAVSGSNERVLNQANLPAIDLTTDEQGLHRHTMRSVENDNGKQNLQNLFMGKYDTDEQLWNGGMDGATINNGNYAQIGAAMEGAGAHTHTVSLGGSGTALDITPKSMAVNQFVYLGV